MNNKTLLRKLKDTQIEERLRPIEQYLKEMEEGGRDLYRRFYWESAQALENSKGVTRAKAELNRQGYLVFGGISYNIAHQIACVAAGEPIRTPQMEMVSRKIVRENRKLKANRKKSSRLAGQKPHKVREKRAYNEAGQY